MGKRRRLRAAEAAMEAASSYSAWLEAAAEHDHLSGAAEWRAEDESVHYDAASLRQSMHAMRAARQAGRGLELAGLLSEHLYRHLNDISAPGLYEVALAGSKELVEAFVQEADESLAFLARAEVPGIDAAEKLRRFETAYHVFGRTALMLSGGATWGFHHLGVVKALLELDLLPQILSGASTGAMIAAGVCGRTEPELRAMYEDTEVIRLDGLAPVGWRKALGSGAWLDPAQLREVLRHNCGDWTFAEAHARSGRVLNISVSPTRTRQKARVLSHLTAPDVLIASAAVASSALPGLYPPVVLEQRSPAGDTGPYAASERWVDGSLHGDLPKQRLSRLHGVNHFIVSQTNPHILPFVAHRGRGVRATVAGFAGATVRSQGAYAADIARRATPRGPVSQFANQAYAFVNQDYGGDIDIHPRFHIASYRKVVSNPSREDLARFIIEGQRAVFPQVAKIRDQTRLGLTFERCIARLRAQLGPGAAPPPPGS